MQSMYPYGKQFLGQMSRRGIRCAGQWIRTSEVGERTLKLALADIRAYLHPGPSDLLGLLVSRSQGFLHG